MPISAESAEAKTIPGQTLAAAAEVSGVGLHSGDRVHVCLKPAAVPGIRFRRVDLPGQPAVAVRPDHLQTTPMCTCAVADDVTVRTTEHLLAAVSAAGITALDVELDREELPILDGSSLLYVELLTAAGRQPAGSPVPVATLAQPVWVDDGEAHLLALPAEQPGLRITYLVDYRKPLAGKEIIDFTLSEEYFATQLAPARTFALAEWVEELRRQGLIAGGSLDSAVVIFDDRLSSPLRMDREFARHKALDLVGDLTWLGCPLSAHIVACKGSHRLNARLVRGIAAASQPEKWECGARRRRRRMR